MRNGKRAAAHGEWALERIEDAPLVCFERVARACAVRAQNLYDIIRSFPCLEVVTTQPSAAPKILRVMMTFNCNTYLKHE